METRDKLQLAMPVIALLTLLMFALDRNFWMGAFKYRADMTCEQVSCMLHVVIRNDGFVVEEGVEFELPEYPQHTSILVDRAHEVVKRGDRTVLQLGLIHAGKTRRVAVFYPPDSATKLNIYQAKFLGIWSKARTAAYDRSGDEEPFWEYWFGWFVWFGLAYIAVVALAAIYLWLFQPPEKRKKRLQKQVEKLDKQIAALNAMIEKRQMASK